MSTYTIAEIKLALNNPYDEILIKRLKSNKMAKVLQGNLLNENCPPYDLAMCLLMKIYNQDEFVAKLKPESVDMVMLQILHIQQD